MTTMNSGSLLDTHESAPVIVFNTDGRSPFLILGDHAGNAIPRSLGTLGLSATDRARHIAVDIGVRDLGKMMAQALDAPFIHQHYSRLVIDCNRDPGSAEAIPETSDGSLIPGNANLSNRQRADRIDAIHKSYHDRIAAEIARRTGEGRPTILIALHSFTPVMAGIARPWHVGVLYSEGDIEFATALLKTLRQDEGIITGDNEPYRMDKTDHTIPRHAFARRLPYAELEVRQDLIADEAGRRAWCQTLSAAFESAFA